MKTKGDVSCSNSHQNNSIYESKDTQLSKMSERELRSLLLKIVRDLEEDASK
jgi:hypothetical protein